MLSKTYEPNQFENKIQNLWDNHKVFQPKKWNNGTHINILPPPNANGELHLGHASGYTIMDIAWRFARMNWKETLLLPWKDHAWILTQVVFERKILEEKWISKKDLWREEFYKQCYDFCIESSEIMRSQEKRIWISADWDREKFTLDPTISEEVLKTFVKMYDDWIAYKWNRIINWCPSCQTALSDMEVEHKEQDSKFYWIKYWPFVLATARPETKLWDTAVAVHPDDERYKDMIWKKYKIPWVLWEFEIIVVWDESVDSSFWSWAVKVTPAHSFVDFDIAQKHWIESKMIINKEWKMMDNCWKYAWMTTFECRKEIVKDMQKMWLIEKIDENYVNKISIHDRCWKIIEPLISEQWWINVDHPKFSLKKEAIKAVKSWKIKIVPKHFEKTFFHWMENLNDWCVSRQIWWSQQIPAWYKSWEIKVQLESPWDWWIQDPDTFDTWFSSGQWAHNTVCPFWEDNKYFPWDFMVMWRDILFFWACRMIMFSLYSKWEIPFKTLYLTWLIKDKDWKKMSKSKWNWIDPLEMADKYWTDALRLSLFIWNSPWNDMRLYEEKIKNYRNFVNKLWNASRFVEMQLDQNKETLFTVQFPISTLTESDKWILTSLQRLIHEVTNEIRDYQYSNAGQKLYDFTWSEFCDWYLELSKWKNQNIWVLVYVLQTLLKLLHPFIPFVTEVIYWEIFNNKSPVATMPWPETVHDLIFKDSLKNIDDIINIVKSFRNIRTQMWIEPWVKISAKIKTSKLWVINLIEDIKRLARIENLEIWENVRIQESWEIMKVLSSKITIAIPQEWNIDNEKLERNKEKEIEALKNQIKNLESRLANKAYIDKAPEALVNQTKSELEEAEKKLKELE